MIIPQFWAEGRVQERVRGRQVTVRRFGWSDVSQDEAEFNAGDRAREAFDRLVAGEKIERRERRRPYNGSDGVPIREEIVGRHGTAVITRNSYGARCLNTPDVLFADIDFDKGPTRGLALAVTAVLLVGGLAIGVISKSKYYGWMAITLALVLGSKVAAALDRVLVRFRGAAEERAQNRIAGFLVTHPEWHLRLYRTPAGFRVLAMHQAFDAHDPAVAEFFRALGTDPIYVRMCLNQRCFRARVSPKPWRIGIDKRFGPRPGVWPVPPDRLPARREWIAAYEEASRGFASCRFVGTMGRGGVSPAAQAVQVVHDELCRAGSGLPIA